LYGRAGRLTAENGGFRPGKEEKRADKLRSDIEVLEASKPKRPITGFFRYSASQRPALKRKQPDASTTELASRLGQLWRDLSSKQQNKYIDAAGAEMAQYEMDREEHRKQLEALRKKVATPTQRELDSPNSKEPAVLVNKVVTIDDMPEQYFFVLTYIPDLQWCRVAPMRRAGSFGKHEGKHEGHPRWVLRPGDGRELDISATRCHVCRASAVRRTTNADKEEWDMHGVAESDDEEDTPEGLEDLAALTAPQLRALLKTMGIKNSGTETDLRGRLRVDLDRHSRFQRKKRHKGMEFQEMPISGRAQFVQSGSNTKTSFKLDTFVFAKVKGYGWWPGRICIDPKTGDC
jgi:hypothetical protein